MAIKMLIARPSRLRLAAALHWLQTHTLERPAVTLGLALALFLASSVVVLTNLVNHDVSWFYYMSQRWLDGARLYVDIVNMNLPMVVYLTLPPAWLAGTLHLPPVPVLLLYFLALLAGVLVFVWSLLRRLELGLSAAERGLVFLTLMTLLFPLFDFGQREHLLLMLVMPYLLAGAAQATGQVLDRRLLLAVGALAGLGLALKPYFLVLWPALEMYRTRLSGVRPWRRPENEAIAAVLVLSVLAVALLTPDYFTLAAIALQTYDAYNVAPATLLSQPPLLAPLVGSATWWAWRRHSPARALGDVLAIAVLALLAAALLQLKGWWYQFYPSNALLVLLALLVFMAVARRAPAGAGALRLAAAAAGLTLFGVVGLLAGARLLTPDGGPAIADPAGGPVAAIRYQLDQMAIRHLAERVQAYSDPGDYFYAFTGSLTPAFPLVHLSETRWPSRFDHLWPLPAQYRDVDRQSVPFPYHTPAQMGPVERFTFQATIADLRAHPPAVVLVNTVADKQGFGLTTFDYLEYFGQDPDFAAWWADYRFVEQVGTFRLYTRR